jgi:hypothetical protein
VTSLESYLLAGSHFKVAYLLALLHEPLLSPASFALPPSGVILAKMPGFSSTL